MACNGASTHRACYCCYGVCQRQVDSVSWCRCGVKHCEYCVRLSLPLTILNPGSTWSKLHFLSFRMSCLLWRHYDVWLMSFPQFYHSSGVDSRQTPNTPFWSVRICRSLPLGSDSSLQARNFPLMLFPCSFDCQLRCSRWEIKLAWGHDSYVYASPSLSLCRARRYW